MNRQGIIPRFVLLFFLVVLAVVLANCTKDQLQPESSEVEMRSIRAEEKQTQKLMTQLELQSELMGYADRFATILSQGFEDFDALQPTPRQRYVVLGDFVYASRSRLLASGPRPIRAGCSRCFTSGCATFLTKKLTSSLLRQIKF